MSDITVTDNFAQFAETVRHNTARALTQALILGGAEVAGFTPQHKGNLINTKFQDVRQEGEKIIGTFGYTAAYAAAVHQATGKLKGLPRPAEKGKPQGNFWDPRGEPHFVTKGFAAAQPEIEKVLAKLLKV